VRIIIRNILDSAEDTWATASRTATGHLRHTRSSKHDRRVRQPAVDANSVVDAVAFKNQNKYSSAEKRASRFKLKVKKRIRVT